MATYKWTSGVQYGGCPGPENYIKPGWYSGEALPSSTPIATSYKNPSTGKSYTPQELQALAGGGTATETPAAGTASTPAGEGSSGTPALTSGNINPYTGKPFTTADLSGMGVATISDFWNFYNQGQIQDGQYVGEAGAVGTGGWGENAPTDYNVPGGSATTPEPVPLPSLGDINVPAPAVTPAPPFEISPQQLAWQEKVGGYLTETLEMGGRGIPEETMALMTQRTTDTLKAKEAEDIRVMRNNMERRGITNSGFTFSNEQKIRSNTTVAIANSITDLNIKNSLMKMASFETAMGQAAQFLGYLGEMSQLKHQPKYQTWAAEQQAKLYQYQAKMDIYKTQLVQAYAQQNMILQGEINAEAAAQQNIWDVEMAEMEIEAANQQAAAQGMGNLFGTTVGMALA